MNNTRATAIPNMARDVIKLKERKRELEGEIRREEEALMERLLAEGRVDCLSINWTRLKRL